MIQEMIKGGSALKSCGCDLQMMAFGLLMRIYRGKWHWRQGLDHLRELITAADSLSGGAIHEDIITAPSGGVLARAYSVGDEQHPCIYIERLSQLVTTASAELESNRIPADEDRSTELLNDIADELDSLYNSLC